MKKKFLACMLIMMLTITGCSSKSITQTLFVRKNNKYALCTSEGDLKQSLFILLIKGRK